MIQITHSHKSDLAEILSLAQMFLKNMCPLVTFPFICFSSMLWPIVLLRSRKKKEGNCVTLFGTLEKSQTLQEPGSETDFAELNVLCIMAAPRAVDVSVLMENFCFTFRQNEVLWREVVSLRQNHSQQQKVINKVVVI